MKSLISILKHRLDKILCYYGYHQIAKGVGWSGTNRHDLCIRGYCKYSYWIQDIEGRQLRDFKIRMISEKRRVLIEKHKHIKTNTDFFNRMMGLNQQLK